MRSVHVHCRTALQSAANLNVRIIDRLRGNNWSGLLSSLRPRHIDFYLYYSPVCAAKTELPAGYVVSHHDRLRKSGVPVIDSRLTGSRECYLVRLGQTAVHWSWLFRDTLLPAQFGFDAAVPTIGDCYTDERFRGRGIYRCVLQYIRADVALSGHTYALYILVAPDNLGSIRGIEAAGFQQIARLQGIRWLGMALKRQLRWST